MNTRRPLVSRLYPYFLLAVAAGCSKPTGSDPTGNRRDDLVAVEFGAPGSAVSNTTCPVINAPGYCTSSENLSAIGRGTIQSNAATDTACQSNDCVCTYAHLSEGYVVTALHCLMPSGTSVPLCANRLSIRWRRGGEAFDTPCESVVFPAANATDADRELDIAIIRVGSAPGGKLPGSLVLYTENGDMRLNSRDGGMTLVSFGGDAARGTPCGSTPVTEQGGILTHPCPTVAGMSGAILFDRSGVPFGIHTRSARANSANRVTPFTEFSSALAGKGKRLNAVSRPTARTFPTTPARTAFSLQDEE